MEIHQLTSDNIGIDDFEAITAQSNDSIAMNAVQNESDFAEYANAEVKLIMSEMGMLK